MLDLGIARMGEQAGTRTGMMLGTPANMAPEQGVGHASAVGPWTDVFALAVLLIEMVSGRPPPEGENAWWSVAFAGEARLQEGIVRELPAELRPLAFNAMRLDRTQRIQNAGELRKALQAAMQGIAQPQVPTFAPTMLATTSPSRTVPSGIPQSVTIPDTTTARVQIVQPAWTKRGRGDETRLYAKLSDGRPQGGWNALGLCNTYPPPMVFSVTTVLCRTVRRTVSRQWRDACVAVQFAGDAEVKQAVDGVVADSASERAA